MSYVERAGMLLEDCSSSDWLKRAVVELLDNCDVLDALNDVEMLESLLLEKFEEMRAADKARRGCA